MESLDGFENDAVGLDKPTLVISQGTDSNAVRGGDCEILVFVPRFLAALEMTGRTRIKMTPVIEICRSC
ncbi:MAG: hypothetical protein ACP5M0_07995 [Desulfomonilaceae bacterium]